jgi:hypothetical protein
MMTWKGSHDPAVQMSMVHCTATTHQIMPGAAPLKCPLEQSPASNPMGLTVPVSFVQLQALTCLELAPWQPLPQFCPTWQVGGQNMLMVDGLLSASQTCVASGPDVDGLLNGSNCFPTVACMDARCAP